MLNVVNLQNLVTTTHCHPKHDGRIVVKLAGSRGGKSHSLLTLTEAQAKQLCKSLTHTIFFADPGSQENATGLDASDIEALMDGTLADFIAEQAGR